MFLLMNRWSEVDLGPIPDQHCEFCRGPQPFHMTLHYLYEHLFFLFGMVRTIRYFMKCETCGGVVRVKAQDAVKLSREFSRAIPFMRRNGCLILFIVVFLVFFIHWLVND